jgi:putative DNA primase/helicase
VHIYYKTSNGKTIVLQLAATVFGNGARASRGGLPTAVQSWHGTANAIEAQTAANSGILDIRDEVGVNRGHVSPYSQAGGQGKGRAKADGSLQDGRSWSTQILSSGEISMAEHIESTTGRSMMGGEAVRMIGVQSGGLLNCCSLEVVDALKENCGRYYGVAGPAFAQWVLNRFDGNADALSQQLTGEVDLIRDQLCDEVRAAGQTLQNEHVRVMRSFALQAAAGCWAVQAGILPLSEDEVMDAVRQVRDAWLGGLSSVSVGAKGIQKVRDYVQARRGQMLAVGSARERNFVPGMDPGILHDGCVLLTQATFEDVCGGLDADLVVTALEASGILKRKDDQRKAQVSIAKLGVTKQRFYVLDLVRLFGQQEDTSETEEDVSTDLLDNFDPTTDI